MAGFGVLNTQRLENLRSQLLDAADRYTKGESQRRDEQKQENIRQGISGVLQDFQKSTQTQRQLLIDPSSFSMQDGTPLQTREVLVPPTKAGVAEAAAQAIGGLAQYGEPGVKAAQLLVDFTKNYPEDATTKEKKPNLSTRALLDAKGGPQVITKDGLKFMGTEQFDTETGKSVPNSVEYKKIDDLTSNSGGSGANDESAFSDHFEFNPDGVPINLRKDNLPDAKKRQAMRQFYQGKLDALGSKELSALNVKATAAGTFAVGPEDNAAKSQVLQGAENSLADIAKQKQQYQSFLDVLSSAAAGTITPTEESYSGKKAKGKFGQIPTARK